MSGGARASKICRQNAETTIDWVRAFHSIECFAWETHHAIRKRQGLPAYFLAQEIGAKRILIAVPSFFLILFLIRQTIEVWLREMLANRQDVDWICVCSDESAWHVDRDDVAVLRQIPGVPCQTDSEKISVWLRKSQMACRFISQPTRAVDSCPRPLEAQGSDLTSASWLRLTRPEEKGDPLYPSPP